MTEPLEQPGSRSLEGLRIVELGEGTSAAFATKLLGDYGAEVIKVESPTGDCARRHGPFPQDRPDPEASGLFAYLNTNKRSIALDLSAASSRKTIRTLLRSADVLVTNLPDVQIASLDLQPLTLRSQYPSLIVTTVTPTGFDEAWTQSTGRELVSYAMGGLAYSTPGFPDAAADLEIEPPLHPGCFLAETVAGLVAAIGSLSALNARQRTGAGCWVQVSEQGAVASMQQRDLSNPSYAQGPFKHARVFSTATFGRMPNFYLPCADGYVAIPAPLQAHWEKLVEAMGSPPWALSDKFSTGAARAAHCIELKQLMSEWTMTVSGDELRDFGQSKGIPIFNFHSVAKMLQSAQVAARHSVVATKVGPQQALIPGSPVGLQGWEIRRPAPALGEHTAEIIAEASQLRPRVAHTVASEMANTLPLSGIRVLDFGQFIAAPFCAMWLAWLGAEVISIESSRRMTTRTAPPFLPGHAGEPNASGYYNLLNSSKKSCVVDMTTPAGQDLLRRLIRKSDVMVDNFSPGVLDKFGLGYPAVRSSNPRLIALSCSAFGQTGPMRRLRGLHSAINLFSGVADVTGYEGGSPRILGGAFPDPYAGTFGTFAILAALRHRSRTGQGQYIDLAMYETMMTLIPEAIVDFSLNGRAPVRNGNRDSRKAPHGLFPCKATDTWIAICVASEPEWRCFCEATGQREWLEDPRFETLEGRLKHVGELEALIGSWSRTQDCLPAIELLQRHGVAAGKVNRPDELLDDERLKKRGAVIETHHPIVGARRQLGLPFVTDGPPANYGRAPLLGEHTREILSSLLSIDDADLDRLEQAGILS